MGCQNTMPAASSCCWTQPAAPMSSPTPTGSFSVTDVIVSGVNPDYGCCVLALSATQPNLPPGWTGTIGDTRYDGEPAGVLPVFVMVTDHLPDRATAVVLVATPSSGR